MPPEDTPITMSRLKATTELYLLLGIPTLAYRRPGSLAPTVDVLLKESACRPITIYPGLAINLDTFIQT